MFIGYDFFGPLGHGSAFITPVIHDRYTALKVANAIYNELYMDGDTTLALTPERPTQWNYRTVAHAQFNGALEAGSVAANGAQIDEIRIQRRETNGLAWLDVATMKYDSSLGQNFYHFSDRYIKNHANYEYSLVPLAANITGHRVLSNPITPEFEGVFLADRDANYRLIYDIEVESIEHITANAVLEPLNSQYPIVVYGNSNYMKLSVTALFVSPSGEVVDGNHMNVKQENVARAALMDFLKNRKPKIYRDMHGNTKLVTIVDNPKEEPHSQIFGIAKISFSLVEIGPINTVTLTRTGLLQVWKGLEQQDATGWRV